MRSNGRRCSESTFPSSFSQGSAVLKDPGVARKVAVLDRNSRWKEDIQEGKTLDAGDCRWGHTGIPWTDNGGNGGRQWDSDMIQEYREMAWGPGVRTLKMMKMRKETEHPQTESTGRCLKARMT